MHATEVVPAANQIELHPWFQQVRLREFNERHGIRTIAWSPFARGAVLTDPVVAEVAREMGKTAAQIVLRWPLPLGNTAIPKTAIHERMSENLRVRDFTIDAETMGRLAALDRPDGRIGSHSDEVN